MLDVVAAETNKWEEIAIGLDFSPTEIERIRIDQRENVMKCFIRVFDQWKNQCLPPYSWATIVKVLQSPFIRENDLADKISKKFVPAPH